MLVDVVVVVCVVVLSEESSANSIRVLFILFFLVMRGGITPPLLVTATGLSTIDKIENENQMTQNPHFHAQDTPRESVVLSGAQVLRV